MSAVIDWHASEYIIGRQDAQDLHFTIWRKDAEFECRAIELALQRNVVVLKAPSVAAGKLLLETQYGEIVWTPEGARSEWGVKDERLYTVCNFDGPISASWAEVDPSAPAHRLPASFPDFESAKAALEKIAEERSR